MTNIQNPISVSNRELIAKYGSYFMLTTNNFDSGTFEISVEEVFGTFDKFNKWHHLYETQETVKSEIKNRLESALKRIQHEKEKEFGDWIGKSLIKLGVMGKISSYYNFIDDTEKTLTNALEKIPEYAVTYMQGSASIPEFLPEFGTTYYIILDSSVVPVTVQECTARSLNFGGPSEFEYMFDFAFQNENKEYTNTLYSNDIFYFNGKSWGEKNPVFLKKEDAHDYLVRLVEFELKKSEIALAKSQLLLAKVIAAK